MSALPGLDWSARRSVRRDRDGDDTCAGGWEDTPTVRSSADDESSTSDCLRFFLHSAPLFLVPRLSLVEDDEDDGPPPRRGELSILCGTVVAARDVPLFF